MKDGTLLRKYVSFLYAIASMLYFSFKSIAVKHEPAWLPIEEFT